MFATTGVVPVLFATNDGIIPFPEPANPIDGSELVHA